MKQFAFIAGVLACVLQLGAATLSQSMLLDKYQLQLRQAVQNDNYTAIRLTLHKIKQDINKEVSKSSGEDGFCQGLEYWLDGKYDQAEKQLLLYVKDSGRAGKFYSSALDVLIKIERTKNIAAQERFLNRSIALKNRYKTQTAKIIKEINTIFNNHQSQIKGTIPYIREKIPYSAYYLKNSRVDESSICQAHFNVQVVYRTPELGKKAFVTFDVAAYAKPLGKEQVAFSLQGHEVEVRFGTPTQSSNDRYVLNVYDGNGGRPSQTILLDAKLFKLYFESRNTAAALYQKLRKYDQICTEYQNELMWVYR